jgi:hypothetical protein
MDDPAFMLLQLQENLRFLRTQSGAHVLSCVIHHQAGEPYWTYVLLTYDNHGNVQEYHEPFEGRAEWTNQPLQALRQLHLRVAGLVTNRLTRNSHPRLRTLAEQRHDEAVENSTLHAGNHVNGIRHDMQPVPSSSTSQPSSEHLKSQISAPPSYQTQEMNPSRLHRTCHLSDRDTLDSIDRVSSTRLSKMQAFETGHSVQPQNSGPTHGPYQQPSPALGTESQSSGGTISRAVSTSSSNHGFGTDGPSLQQQIAVTARGHRLRSTKTQRRPTGLEIPPLILEKITPDAQISPVNVSSASSYQTQHFRVDADLPENRVQAPVQSSRSQLSRSVNATDIPQGLIGMRAIRISPDANNDTLQQRSNTNTLSQPLSSHPPYPGDPIYVALSPETWALRQTNPEEYRRRLDTNSRAQEKLRTRDPIAYIEYEAAEFLNRDSEPDDQTLVSVARRIRDHGISSSDSTLPGSPASDETVTPGYPSYRRRRVAQTRYINNETGDPLPPAAPSPPPNSHYPSNLPIYPPTLVDSRSEASTQRQTSNNRGTDSATHASATNRISSSNESMRNTAPFGGSVSSLLRLGPFDQHNSENEHLLRQEAALSRRLSQNHEENQGEQVRLISSPHIFLLLHCEEYKSCVLMIKQTGPRQTHRSNLFER